ncbi:MAG: hypothetical protein QW228_06770 [Candidatus Aenigmatarchaeota archaeon]
MAVRFFEVDSLAKLFLYLQNRSGEAVENLLRKNKFLGRFKLLMMVDGNKVASSATAMQAIASSETAMQAIASSATAMQAIASSETAMQAIASSATAMQTIASSAVAMNILLKSSTSIKAILRSSSIAVNAILNNIATLQNTQYFSYSSQQQTYIGNGTSTYTIPANSLIRITNLYSYDYYPSDAGASGTVTLTDGINSSQIGSYNMNGDGSTTTNIDVNLLCFGNLINTRNVSGSHPSEFRLRITFTVYTAL